jgi:hypothetical protein
MSQALIRQALETALKTWADANSVPVQWQNTIIDPQPAAYLRAFLLPGDTESADLGRLNRRFAGLWQVSICRPIGEGPGAAEVIVQALSAVYSPSVPLTAGGLKVWAAQPLSTAPAIVEPTHYVTPCSVQYLADTY